MGTLRCVLCVKHIRKEEDLDVVDTFEKVNNVEIICPGCSNHQSE